MEDLAGTAVRVKRERHLADEWAVVLAAGNIGDGVASVRGTASVGVAVGLLSIGFFAIFRGQLDGDSGAPAPVVTFRLGLGTRQHR
jgi:hypothetical protein